MTSSDSAPAHAQPSITTVTRHDIFSYLRGISSPWWGKLDEVTFLENLYDLDRPTADNSRLPTVRADIQQHRINNYDLDDDWIFEDSRLELSDGPDEVLLAFLARMVHPEVAASVEEAMKQVEELNRLLAPDGWGLRSYDFLSGRPIYTPVRLPPTGPLVPLPLNDDDTGKLDLVLGQAYSLLDCAGEETACDLLRTAVLTLRRDGGFFNPVPGDGWTADTYAAVLTVERELLPTCAPETKEAIWRTWRPCSASSDAPTSRTSWSKAIVGRCPTSRRTGGPKPPHPPPPSFAVFASPSPPPSSTSPAGTSPTWRSAARMTATGSTTSTTPAHAG
ncbi:hypothetical protein [Streptomyces sp. DASNCL29]|uniref:AbiJ-related protein n=1 Tax=Streptomyces sp. DASNCL29 TaxID=2583819 RepID=UPI001F0FD711|nr:hypothetical protein [Streptomyces sp. DASNCL29]